MSNNTITSIAGLSVGHWSDPEAKTGCTVVLCPPEGCVASGMVMGSSPGSRETALLEPEKTVERVHAILLAGGSSFGLDAATGVMRWLEENGRGYDTPFGKVPIVPAAVIYDFVVGRADIRPDAKAGYEATAAANTAPVEQGAIGVGTGAMIGKYLGYTHASPGGLGSAAMTLGGATVAALVVSNAVGDIVQGGQFIAGAKKRVQGNISQLIGLGMNTTLAVVATDAKLSKTQAYLLSQHAHIGIAKVTEPSHTLYDGDTAFVLSTNQGPEVSLMALTMAVQEIVAKAIINGVKSANEISV
jgi:L-aminopeptidase/D-esterase-like protein